MKNLGALSEYAKWSQSSTKIFFKSLSYSISWIQWYGQWYGLMLVSLEIRGVLENQCTRSGFKFRLFEVLYSYACCLDTLQAILEALYSTIGASWEERKKEKFQNAPIYRRFVWLQFHCGQRLYLKIVRRFKFNWNVYFQHT